MICELYTLMNEYRNKKIYIWNINRNSTIVFTKAVFSKINIQGFVVIEEAYAGEIFMNRPVITLQQVLQEDNSIILASDDVPVSTFKLLPDDKVIYWNQSREINKELQKKKIIIYGTGWGADRLCEALKEDGLEAELYCVTKRNCGIMQYKEKKVIEAAELEQYEDYAVIISVVTARYRSEILEALSDFRGQIYIEHIIDKIEILSINLVHSIDAALKNRQKIYLYSKKSAITNLIEEALQIYDITISGYVYDTENKEQGIKSIFELSYDGIEDKLIIINEGIPENLIRARENVELAGFSLEKGNYTGFQLYTYANEDLLSKFKVRHDPLAGVSILYSPGKPGWKVYGREAADRIKILILGGSTSSELFHPEHWISKLYYRLDRENIKTTIYNGAHSGNDIVTEMMRLLRDGYVLQPQIVISMSGVNNLYYKQSSNLFNNGTQIQWVQKLSPYKEYCSGVYSDESLHSFWSRNIKMLKVISEFYGAKFFGFLQPMNVTMSHMSLREKSLYESEVRLEGTKEFAQAVGDNNGYINLMRLFEHQNDMYIDECHYTDKGHEIIADKVYEAIMPALIDLQGKKVMRAGD